MEHSNLKDKIVSYFENNRSKIEREIVSLLKEMVAQKTVNVIPEKLAEHPYLKMRGEEYKVAEIVKEVFDKEKIRYEIFEREKGRTNIIGKIGKGINDKKLLIACHMDIVPAGDGWVTDPFDMVEKDGKLYGRGVLDNKGPLVSSIISAKVIKSVLGEEVIEGELQVAGLADEEAHSGVDYGIGYLLEEKLINPTYAIIPDIGENMEKIDIAEKGRTVLKVISKGVQAHGSTPEKGVNAVYPMAYLVTKLQNWVPKYEPHPILIKPTVNLGEIHGGIAANIVPAECSIYLDIRTLPGQTEEGLINEIKSIYSDIKGDFSIEVQSSTKPHQISPDNPLVKAIQSNCEKLNRKVPQPYGLGGGTFAKTLNLEQIIAVGFGPGDPDAFHASNEYVELSQLVDFACLISLISLDLL